MNISAVNCTPIKPQTSFKGNDDNNYQTVIRTTDELNETFVNSKTIKKPIAAIGSVALACVFAFAAGKKLAKFVPSSAAVKFEEILKKGSKSMQGVSEKLTNESTTKLSKVKNAVGKAIGKTEEFARNAYKKVAYRGLKNEETMSEVQKAAQKIKDEAIAVKKEKAEELAKKAEEALKNAITHEEKVKAYNLQKDAATLSDEIATELNAAAETAKQKAAEKSQKAFQNIVGVATTATVVPPILGADYNRDGVNDLFEDCQNAYTGTKSVCNNTLKKAGIISELFNALT